MSNAQSEEKLQIEASRAHALDERVRTLELDHLRMASAFSRLARDVLVARKVTAGEIVRLIRGFAEENPEIQSILDDLCVQIQKWVKEYAEEE